MNVLVLYDRYSTHTNTVYDHVASFARFSRHRHVFCHSGSSGRSVPWAALDAVVIHYSARLISLSVSDKMRQCIREFGGAKILFVQDEYDLTERLRKSIEDLAIDLVYTCVPLESIERIYPTSRFPRTRFVSTLTGFVPAGHATPVDWTPLAKRSTWVGYRGRALPFWYGDLGQEKQEIAERFRRACELRAVPCDIEWDDRHRIYGPAWDAFLGSCRATLGTESGSNLFDDHGHVRADYTKFLRAHPDAAYHEARQAVVGNGIEDRLMNQVSPRVFEAISAGTGLILYEGTYSGVIQPDLHFIPLRKDFSNIDEVFSRLEDERAMEVMIRRAYDDVIGSGAWSYPAFVAGYDNVMTSFDRPKVSELALPKLSGDVTETPLRAESIKLPQSVARVWRSLPQGARSLIYPAAHGAVNILKSIRRR